MSIFGEIFLFYTNNKNNFDNLCRCWHFQNIGFRYIFIVNFKAPL